MLLRVFASAVAALALASLLRAQDAVIHEQLPPSPARIESAWLDLRQVAAVNSKPQTAPGWIESVEIVPAKENSATTVFRIRVSRPSADLHVLLFRLFFDDQPQHQPKVIAWDETASQVLQSHELGSGVGLPTSETLVVPMTDASAIDVEVPGDGTTIRSAYLDWLSDSQVLHPVNADHRDLAAEPFAAAAPVHAPAQDLEQFGTVTATLAQETILMGPSVQNGAAFQFGLETQPLAALLTFEVGTPNIDSPPEVYINGEDVGPATMVLPDLADPAYRGEMGTLMRQMRFQYTGWIRAQKLVPASSLRTGTNDLLLVAGPGTPASAVRATQIQLKYVWDKLDYQLLPDRPDAGR
jgi:hypothetical protein